MTEQIKHQDEEITPLEGTIESPSQMQRLFKTRDAALDFAKDIREGDVLLRGGVVDGKQVWQLTYNNAEGNY